MTLEQEDSAALACIASLTEWFEPGGDSGLNRLHKEDPSCVAGFLFGQLVASIEDIAELLDIDPQEYVRQIALQHYSAIHRVY